MPQEVFSGGVDNPRDLMRVYGRLLQELNNSAQNSRGEQRTQVDVFLIDIDIGINKDYDLNTTYRDVVLAAGERFSIQDTTYTKAYRYVRNGDFKIVGEQSRDVSLANSR